MGPPLLNIMRWSKQHGRILTFILLISVLAIGLPVLSVGKTAASPSMLIVNTNDDTDDGTCNAAHCSLREAINTANALPSPETIQFTIPATATINLTINTPLPVISDTLTINGDGQNVRANPVGGYSQVFKIGTGTAVTLTHLGIRNGSTRNSGEGGGINNLGDLTIINSTVAGNDSDGFARAGGIYNGSGNLTIIGSTLTRNSSGFYAGAIYNEFGILTIENSTISDNSSNQGSGGIINWIDGTLIMNHITMAENFGNGADQNDIWNVGSLYMSNSMFEDCYESGTIVLNVNNLIENGGCDADFSGDPKIGPLQNYGGPTDTHTLLAGSPAIDNADSAYCLDTDQRGIPRPDGAECDIGAFEGFYTPTAVSLTEFSGISDDHKWLWVVGLSAVSLTILILSEVRKSGRMKLFLNKPSKEF